MEPITYAPVRWTESRAAAIGASQPALDEGLGIDLLELTLVRPASEPPLSYWETFKQDVTDWWRLSLRPLMGAIWAPPPPDVSLSRTGKTYVPLITEAARRHGIPPELLLGLVERESGGDPRAVGDGGKSKGLGQIYQPAHPRFHAQNNPFDPAANIDYAARLLKSLYNRFNNWEAALAGYNAGSGAVERALNSGRSPDSVTHNGSYVKRVMATAHRFGYRG